MPSRLTERDIAHAVGPYLQVTRSDVSEHQLRPRGSLPEIVIVKAGYHEVLARPGETGLAEGLHAVVQDGA
jgi:hypothetical protein